MEIDISIRNATPEELQQFIQGLTLSNDVKASRKGMEVNFQQAIWSPEEKAAVTGCKDKQEAWQRYREKFPDSKRTKHAIRRMFLNLTDEGKIAPTKPSGYSNKWNIPIDPVKEPAKYEAARKLCKKFGKPYSEALKLKEAADEAERQKTPEKVEKRTAAPKKAKDTGVEKKVKKTGHRIPCPYCGKARNSHGMHMHIRGAHPDMYPEWSKTPDRLHQGIHKPAEKEKDPGVAEPTSQEVIKNTANPPHEPILKHIEDASPVHHITRGDKIRHTAAFPLFPGVGTVVKTSINGKEVMVDFGNGAEWLDRKNLELVPGETKA